jgi:hypothetical protein
MRNKRPLPFIYLLVLFTAANLGGCSTVSPPGDAELSEIETGKRTLLLLRVAASIEGKNIEPFSKSGLDSNVGIAVGTFETGGRSSILRPCDFCRTTRMRKDGLTFPSRRALSISPFLPSEEQMRLPIKECSKPRNNGVLMCRMVESSSTLGPSSWMETVVFSYLAGVPREFQTHRNS